MNTNIALQAQRPRFNALADRNAAMQIQGQQAEQQYNMLRMQAQAQEMQRASQARNALAGLDPNSPDYFNQAAQATQSIDPSMAAGYAQQGQARKLADLSLDAKQLDIVGKRAKAAAQLFNPAVVTDEASWQAAMARGEQLGLNVPRGTPYSAEAVKALQLGALDVKDQLAQQNADRTAKQNAIGKTEPFPEVVARQKVDIARSGRTEVAYNSNVEKEEDKAYGKTLVKEFEEVRGRADNAATELQALNMLKSIDVDTSAIEPAKAWVSKYAEALGFNPQNIGLETATNAQAFVGIANKLILTVMQAQKGPQTENDAKRIQKTVASLGNTPAAKDFLTDAAIALREREVEQADFYDAWRAKTKSFDGARSAWNDYKKRTPLMGTNPTTGLPVFFNQYLTGMRAANPQADEAEIRKLWRKKYGR